MNGAPADAVRWTRRRWFYSVAAVFCAQVGLIFLLGKRVQPSPAPIPFRTAIYAAVDPLSEQQLARLPTLEDPTIFALPSHHGFSGTAWLNFAPLQFHLTDWTESPRWLEMEVARLGETFSRFVATNLAPPLLIAEKPLPRLIASDPPVPNEAMAAKSELRFEGDLAQRPLRSPLTLPSWAATEILTNTVVQLLVDAEGQPVFTTLLGSCGLYEADQSALKLAAGARFKPARTGDVVEEAAGPSSWGRMIFQWHTIAPLATNSSAPPP